MAADGEYDESVIGRIIAESVARPGWSQARLAKALDLRPQTINKWVKGENVPRREVWFDIEQALGLPRFTFWEAISPGITERRQQALDALVDASTDQFGALQGWHELPPEDRAILQSMADRMLGK